MAASDEEMQEAVAAQVGDGSGSSDSDSDDEDLSLDISEEDMQKIMALESELEQNPNAYDTHVQVRHEAGRDFWGANASVLVYPTAGVPKALHMKSAAPLLAPTAGCMACLPLPVLGPSSPQPLQFIDVLRRCKMRERLREARATMHRLFPLSESLWLDWVGDELEGVAGEEDIPRLEQLMEKAVGDYLSVPLWLQYLGWVASAASGPF